MASKREIDALEAGLPGDFGKKPPRHEIEQMVDSGKYPEMLRRGFEKLKDRAEGW